MCRSDCDGLLDVMFEIAWRDNVNDKDLENSDRCDILFQDIILSHGPHNLPDTSLPTHS